MKKKPPPIHQVELRIVALSELFNSMDPTPFHHRKLDADAEEFLETWALEFPRTAASASLSTSMKCPKTILPR